MLLFSVMAAAIKGIVSKNKIRYKEDGFDLDLSYISRNIIAMGFPAETLERFYRNHIDDVVRFFDLKHNNHYRIYNLCSEAKRRYDVNKFHGQVNVEYSFQDHNPPPFEILKPFCESVTKWLKAHSENVAGIHCKAGKGRTGVMICAYLVHSGGYENAEGIVEQLIDADEALEYYARYRTSDLKGVTIPSQKRYVYYYEELVKRQLDYRLVPLKLSSVILSPVPVYNGGSYTLTCEIYTVLPKTKIKSFNIEVKKGCKSIIHNLADELCVTGDVKFEFYLKKMKKEKIFQFCVNTFFIGYGTDVSTVVSDPCRRCSGKSVSIISGKGGNVTVNPNNSQSDASVIDFSFLDLAYTSRDEPFHYCDCTLSSHPADFFLHSNSTAPHSSNDTGIHNPSSSLPSTSSLNHENKSSISSTSTSSSSSIQSLNHKANNSDLQLSKPPKRDLYVVLPKDKIDKAYKDKSNKSFPSDFKVILNFNSLGVELKPSPKLHTDNFNCALYDNTSSDNDTDNEYSEDEEETSDLENNPTERNCTFSSNARLNSKKGETTHL